MPILDGLITSPKTSIDEDVGESSEVLGFGCNALDSDKAVFLRLNTKVSL
jgi:hypothetical protein